MQAGQPGSSILYARPPGGERRLFALADGEPTTFGRSLDCDIPLDLDDRSISSTAGRVWCAAGVWLVENLSRFATLELIGRSDTAYLAPGTGDAEMLHDGDIIVVPSQQWRHELRVELLSEPVPTMPLGSGTVDLLDAAVSLSDGQLAVVTALVLGWLVPERFDPVPLTCNEIAALVGGVTSKAVARRLETAREKLGRGIGRPIASNYELAEVARRMRLVRRADALAMIGRT